MGNAMQQGSPVACDPGSCCRPPGSLRHGSVNAAAGSFGPLKEAAVFCVVGLTTPEQFNLSQDSCSNRFGIFFTFSFC